MADHTNETRTTLSNVLKYRYEGPLRDITPERSKTLNLLQKGLGKSGWGGKSITDALQFNYFGSASAVAEGGTLPASTPVNNNITVIPMKYNYFSVSVTGIAMATTRDTASSFGEAWAMQVFNKMKSHRQHMNRQSLGDGNGYLAQVAETPSLSGSDYTVKLDNAFGISGMNNSVVNGHTFISTNMLVDFYSGSTCRDVGACKITSWTRGAFPSTEATAVFVSGDLDSVANGDYMYTEQGYGNECMGLRGLIDDDTVASTVQSLSALTYAEWRSQMGYGSTEGTAEPLTSLRMGTLETDIEQAGGNTRFILTSPAVWLTYGDMCNQENLHVNVTTMDNGWKKAEYNGIPIYKDPVMWDEMFWVDTDTIKMYEVAPEGWLDLDGDIIKQTAQKDVWEAYWGWYMNFGTVDRSKNGKLVDITVRANTVAR